LRGKGNPMRLIPLFAALLLLSACGVPFVPLV
jgi:hypothetical protein